MTSDHLSEAGTTFPELVEKGLRVARGLHHHLRVDVGGKDAARYRCIRCRLEFQVGYRPDATDPANPGPLELFGPALTTLCPGRTTITPDAGG